MITKILLPMLAASCAASIAVAGVEVQKADITDGKYLFQTSFQDTGKTRISTTGGILSQAEPAPALTHVNGTAESWVQTKPDVTFAELIIKFDFGKTGAKPASLVFETAIGVHEGHASLKSYYKLGDTGEWTPIPSADQDRFDGWPALNSGFTTFPVSQLNDIVYYKVTIEKEPKAKIRWGLEGKEGGAKAPDDSALLTKGHGFAMQFKLK
ncbi:hypothetical protein OPIT5_07230 [Opitutaceae bacterium TAV5]|nr:hypothetical protein OPIT5_07230 [Opitutaceae bacterium TAV5]